MVLPAHARPAMRPFRRELRRFAHAFVALALSACTADGTVSPLRAAAAPGKRALGPGSVTWRVDSLKLPTHPVTAADSATDSTAVPRDSATVPRDSAAAAPGDTATKPSTAPSLPATPSTPPTPATPTSPVPEVPAAPPTAAPPTLPRLLDTSAPEITGKTRHVPAGGDLQAALNAAQPGDVITLANGATYTGNFVLPLKAGSTPTAGGWITIRPASLTGLPVEGTRFKPGMVSLPKLQTPNTVPVLATAAGTAGWRFTGIEFTVAADVTENYGLITFGAGTETTLSQYPGRLVLDRSWIHGNSTLHLKRCVALNSIATAVIDSYLSDCHGAHWVETQGLLGWNGPGPFKITNNYIEATGVSIMFGGADDPASSAFIPSDIEVRGNHIIKPLAWKGVWTNKNSFELKDAQRVLVEGNVFENNWVDAQAGWMVQFTPVSQTGTSSWITVRDVTFRYNVLRNSPQGINVVSRYSVSGGVQPSEPSRRITIAHNVFDQMGSGNLIALGGDLDHATIANNTASKVGNTFLMLLGGTGPQTGLVVRDNLFAWGLYGLFGDAVGIGLPALATYAPGAVFVGNALLGGSSSALPAGNVFPADPAAAGLEDADVGPIGLLRRVELSPFSRFSGAGTAGTRPGADIALVARAIANAITP